MTYANQWKILAEEGKKLLEEYNIRAAEAKFLQALSVTKENTKEFTTTCLLLAKTYENTEHKKALSYCETVISIYENSDCAQSVEHADALYICAEIYEDLFSDGEKALCYYQKALDIREKVLQAPHKDIVQCLFGIGSIYYFKHNYAKAIPFLREVMQQVEQLQDHEIDVELAAEFWATSLSNEGHYEDAKYAFSRFLYFSEESSTAYREVGDFFSEWGEYSEAETMYRKSLEICQKGGSTLAQNRLAEALYQQKKYNAAWDMWKKVIEVYSDGYTNFENVSVAEIFVKQATILHVEGRYQDALRLATQSLLIFIECSFRYLPSKFYVPDALLIQAISYKYLNDNKKAQQTYLYLWQLAQFYHNQGMFTDSELQNYKDNIAEFYKETHGASKWSLPEAIKEDGDLIQTIKAQNKNIPAFYTKHSKENINKKNISIICHKIAGLEFSFELANEYRAEKIPGCVQVFIPKNTSSLDLNLKDILQPDILITVIQGRGDLQQMLDEQKDFTKTNPDQKLRECKIFTEQNIPYAMMIIHHLKSNQIHVSYVCVTDNKAFSCGYRYPADEKQPKTNNKLIHDIFATVQFKNTNSSQRVSIQSSGFSICLPDGWERQDLLNQIIVYAPGNNFRPRISTSDHDEQEEDWASPQQVIEEFCEVVKYMKHLYKDVKWGKIEEIMDSQHQGLMMKWEAAIKRRNGKFVDVIGIIVAVPHNSRGAIVNYQAPRESFCQFEDVFWQTIDSIQWLK